MTDHARIDEVHTVKYTTLGGTFEAPTLDDAMALADELAAKVEAAKDVAVRYRVAVQMSLSRRGTGSGADASADRTMAAVPEGEGTMGVTLRQGRPTRAVEYVGRVRP